MPSKGRNIVDTLQKGHLQGLGHSLVMIELKYIMPSCPTKLERYILCVQKARPILQANVKDEPSWPSFSLNRRQFRGNALNEVAPLNGTKMAWGRKNINPQPLQLGRHYLIALSHISLV